MASRLATLFKRRLRSAFLSLKRKMSLLWTYYDYPELKMPNTNNAIESLNADLKKKINLHKGISMERRKIFIQDFTSTFLSHKRE